jgi:uncharacterized protein
MMAMVFSSYKKPFAIVGASNNQEKYGNIIMRDLLSKSIRAIPINPNEEQVEGIKCYSSLSDAAKDHDIGIVIIVIPPSNAMAVIDEMALLGISDAWFQPGSESEEAVRLCEKHKINYAVDACIMKTI